MKKKPEVYEVLETQREQIRHALKEMAPQQVQRFDHFCQQFRFETFNSGLVLGAIGSAIVLMILWWVSGALR